MTEAAANLRRGPALVLDTGAIIALSRDDVHARNAMVQAHTARSPVFLPVVVLTETLRGGPRDALVHRVVNSIDGDFPVSSAMARRAGRLLGETGSSAGAVDAIVAATAISMRPSVILTSDPGDMRQLVRDHPDVTVYPI